MAENLIIGLTEIIVVGIVAQWLAWRFKLPSILILLVFGFILGPVTGILDPDHIFGDLFFPIVSLSVAVVLFEGGLSLRLSELGRSAVTVRNLVTIGILVTWILGAVAAYYLTSLSLELSLLLGAILVVSGPTVIVPLLRYVRPVGHVGTIVKWEGIVNDPLGAALAVLVFEAIVAREVQQATTLVLLGILKTVVIGGALGVLGAIILAIFLRRYWIPDFLQNPIVLMMVILVFTTSNLLQQDAGLFTVTVMGVYLSNQRNLVIKHIVEFKENLRTLLISGLFIILAARLDFSIIQELGWGSIIFVLALILVIRPIAVFLSTINSGLNWREKAFLSWMAPRGIVAAAVSAVFALELHEAGFEHAEAIVPLTFLVIIATVLVYGLTAAPVGRWLKVAHPDPQGVLISGGHDWARQIAQVLNEHGFRTVLVDTNRRNIDRAKSEGLEAHRGSIVSEPIIEELDLGGIGRLLALTPNDEINSLAALHFIEAFGRTEVYQLALQPKAGETEQKETVANILRGRCLFNAKATFAEMDKAFHNGAEFESFNLTPNFTFKDFQDRYGDKAIPMFIITETKDLNILATDNSPVPRPGQRLISLILDEASENI